MDLTEAQMAQVESAILDPTKFRYVFLKRKSHPAQDAFLVSEADVVTIVAGRRLGKALDIETPVLTTTGWKTMGTLVRGDFVFGPDGKPVEVEWVSEIRYDRPCYRLTFSDGQEIIADAEHEWVTESKAYRKNKVRWKNGVSPSKQHQRGEIHPSSDAPGLWTTEQISQNYQIPRTDSRVEFNHAIPVCQPLEYDKANLEIDPYVLGVWLGDGHERGGQLACEDKEIFEEIERRGYEIKWNVTGDPNVLIDEVYGTPVKTNPAYKRKHKSKEGQKKGLIFKLRNLALLQNKHIPGEYLRASIEQRTDLLRGLMDTDGYCEKMGGCEFTTISKDLANGVYQLLVSLGIKPRMYSGIAKLYGREIGPKYRIHFSATFSVFNLPRKKCRERVSKKTDIGYRFIISVKPCQSIPVCCISVKNESHQFLAGKGLIATHNSVAMSDSMTHFALTKPGSIQFLLAPTYDQTDITFSECVGTIENSLLRYLKEKVQRTPFPKITFKNGSIINFRSTKNPENIRGHKAHRVVLDEAAYITDGTVSNVVEPMLADYDGSLWKISTPFGKNNHFYQTWKKGFGATKERGFDSFHFTSFDNPYISHRYLEKKRAELGADSLVWRTEYLGEFVDDQNVVFSYEMIQSCIDNSIELISAGQQYRAYIVAVDIAKHVDYTVITVLDVTDPVRKDVVYLERFNKKKYKDVVDRILDIQAVFGGEECTPIIIDSTGIGDAVLESLEGWNCTGYHLTNSSKRAIIERLQGAMGANERRPVRIVEDGSTALPYQVRFPFIPVLVKELQVFEYKVTPSKNFTFNAPTNEHDDCVISLALGMWAATSMEEGNTAALCGADDWPIVA